MPSWLYLLMAIVLEVSGTTCMKLSEGFTRAPFAWCMFGLYALSFTALTFALKQIPLSVAYAIWSGLGTAIIALLGVLIFREAITPFKLIGIVLIIAGVVTVNLSGTPH